MNIVRRQVASYPSGHPMITSSVENLLSLMERLLEFRREVTFGIARDLLLLDGKHLDPSNPVYRDLAISLFKARIVSLTILAGSTSDEVRKFFSILNNFNEKVAPAGDWSSLLAAAGIQKFTVREIDYGAFHTTEVASLNSPGAPARKEDPADLWKAFVHGIVNGTIEPGNSSLLLPKESFNPVLLAEVLNREQDSGGERIMGSYDRAIADFLKQSDCRGLDSQSHQELFDRLGQLMERLSPELRRRFLNSSLQGLAGAPEHATRALSNWSQSLIAEALEQIEVGNLQVPRILMEILGKLGRHSEVSSSLRPASSSEHKDSKQTAAQLSQLFRDGEIESYVPGDYADALTILASADIETKLDVTQRDELLASINDHAIERQFCAILLDLSEQHIGSGAGETIASTLKEQISIFVERGDFGSLLKLQTHLTRLLKNSPNTTPGFESILDLFAGEEFVSLVLDGIDDWGKDQFPAIFEMIGRIGLPFVEPLLDRLADDGSMSRRRIYMECVKRIGPPAFDCLVARLGHPRWYLVRNLVILLRELNDSAVLRPLSRLVGHAHPKVRLEVVRAFLQFHDPRADLLLLRELQQADPEVQLGVVRLAAGSRNPEVVRRLCQLLNSRGISEPELALKRAIIETMAEMKCPEALPGLAAFIDSRSLFTPKSLLRLKVDAVASLASYSSPEAAGLATRIHQKSSGEIARAAGRVSMQMRGTHG